VTKKGVRQGRALREPVQLFFGQIIWFSGNLSKYYRFETSGTGRDGSKRRDGGTAEEVALVRDVVLLPRGPAGRRDGWRQVPVPPWLSAPAAAMSHGGCSGMGAVCCCHRVAASRPPAHPYMGGGAWVWSKMCIKKNHSKLVGAFGPSRSQLKINLNIRRTYVSQKRPEYNIKKNGNANRYTRREGTYVRGSVGLRVNATKHGSNP